MRKVAVMGPYFIGAGIMLLAWAWVLMDDIREAVSLLGDDLSDYTELEDEIREDRRAL